VSYIHKGFIYGEWFHQGGVFLHQLNDFAAGMGVLLVVAPDYEQIRTDPLPFPDGHAGLYTECTGFIGGGSDNCSMTCTHYSNGLTLQFRVRLLLY